MKTTLSIIIALGFIIYSSEPKISFKPFSISFESPYIPFALFFMVLSISLFQIQAREKGYYKGAEDMIKEIKLKIENSKSNNHGKS